MKWLRRFAIASTHLVFWVWNLNFVAFALFSFPTLWLELLLQTVRGIVPWNLTIFVVALVALPVVSLVAGWKLRRDPGKLAELFFGLEGPLFLMICVRLFLVRELTAASTFVLAAFFLAMASLAVELYGGLSRDRRVAAAQMVGQSVLLLVGSYGAALLFFYAVPVGAVLMGALVEGITWLPSLLWEAISDISLWPRYLLGGLWGVIVLTTFFLLFSVTGGLFAVMPVTLSWVAIRSWRRTFRAFTDREGFHAAWGATAVAAALGVAGFVGTTRTDVPAVLALVREAPADEAGRRERVARSEEIRVALLSAYLSPYRAWGDTENSDHIEDMWHDTLYLRSDAAAAVQDMHDALARPMLWQGDLFEDVTLAERAYREMFDVSIQKGERDAISRALATTWNQSEAQAGLLDIGERRVLLERQTIAVQTDGDVGRVELREVYLNQTADPQEILYYFSLPETAAVTGLWLSDDPEDLEKYVYQVAPRGAAQQVYREQVQVRKDPALLEQVGPRQYRLRAFPIPAIPWDHTVEQPRMYLKLTYEVMTEGGRVPFPALLERRNVYWDGGTVRGLDGAEFASEGWFPEAAPALAPPVARTTDIDGALLTVTPAVDGPKAMPQGRRYAVVVDGSRSMAARTTDLADAWATVEALAARNDVDVYVTGVAPARHDDPAAFDPATFVFYGAGTPQEMLRQVAEKRGSTAYDAILVLTDGGSYDIAEGAVVNPTTAQSGRSRWDPVDVVAEIPKAEPLPDPGAPVFFVHLGGVLPAGYDDTVLEVIQGSRGGVATGLGEVLARLSLWEVEGKDSVLADGRIWRFTAADDGLADAADAVAVAQDAALSAVAARQRIAWVARQKDMTLVSSLDEVHATARAHGVVTAYSSMIVLVDEAQKRRLEQLEQQQDRFDREHETGEEALTGQAAPFASVPEPEEWALMGLAAVLLLAMKLRGGSSGGPRLAWRKPRNTRLTPRLEGR